MATNSKRVALVIGSGSVKCAAAIGLQNVLRREGIEIGMLVGCSGGSMFAALMALGYDAPTIADMASRLWTRGITRRHSYRDFFSILLPGPLKFSEDFGLVDDRLVMERIRLAFGDRTFADVKTPLYVAATDFLNGEQVVLTEGKLVDAIRGSIAMPYIFKPYRVDGRLLVDGYLSDPLPVGIAIKEGADIIIAMGFDAPYQSRINSLPRFSFQISSIMSNNLYKAHFAFHNMAHYGEVIPIIPEFKQRVGLFDTDKIPYVVEEGERAAEEQVPYIRKLLAFEANTGSV
jgi:NTE family protein